MNAVRTLLLLLGGAASALGQAGQVVSPEFVVDYDYRFSLRVPKGSKVLGETRAELAVPGALTLISHPTLGQSSLSIASDQGKRLNHWGAMSPQALGFLNATMELREDIAVSGIPGKRIVLSAQRDGLPRRIQSVLLLSKGYVYRLNSWLPKEQSRYGAPSLKRMIGSLSLMEGPVRPRSAENSSCEAFGPGWTQQKGGYKNSTFGIKVVRPQGAQLLVPDPNVDPMSGELISITQENLILSIEASKVSAADPKSFLQTLNHLVGFDHETSEELLQCTFLGEPLTFRKHKSPGDERALALFSAALRDGVLYQLSIRGLDSEEAMVIRQVPQWLASVSPLPFAELKQLQSQLKQLSIQEWQIGFDYANQGRKWTDFRASFSWDRPSAAWSVHALSDTPDNPPFPRLLIKNLAYGLMGTVSQAPLPKGSSLYSEHKAEVSKLGGRAVQTQKRTLSQHNALVTRITGDSELPLEHRMFTVQAEDSVWHLNFWALAENWAAAQAELKRALLGFQFSSVPIPMNTIREGVLVDHRMGFRLDSGFQDAGYTQELIPGLDGFGQVSTVRHEAGFTKVVALATPRGAKSHAWFKELIGRQFMVDVPTANRVKPRITRTTLSGIPCERADYRVNGLGVSIHLAFVNGRYFAVINSEMPNDPRKPVSDRFAILR